MPAPEALSAVGRFQRQLLLEHDVVLQRIGEMLLLELDAERRKESRL